MSLVLPEQYTVSAFPESVLSELCVLSVYSELKENFFQTKEARKIVRTFLEVPVFLGGKFFESSRTGHKNLRKHYDSFGMVEARERQGEEKHYDGLWPLRMSVSW